MKYTCVAWDFNGTIMDDVKIGIESVNVLLEKRGLKTLESREEYQRVFGFPIIDYYRRLGFDFEIEPYEEIAVEWVNEYTAREKTACTVDGVRELLNEFKCKGFRQIIISACEQEMLERNLKMLGVADFFDEICGIDNIYASSKVEIARGWKTRNPSEKVLFIGDTDHDLSAAEAMEADCILVAAGHQSYESLCERSLGAKVFKSMKEVKGVC